MRSAFSAFATDVEKTLQLLAQILRGTRSAEKKFPDLREGYQKLLEAGDAHTARYALTNVEADRMTNSLNTLREQISAEHKP